MTFRAVLIGVVVGLFVAAFGFINDQVLRLESLVAGHMVPVGVYGLFVVLVLAINPLIAWARQRWAFRPAELAVMILLATAGASVPGRGLMEQFVHVLILPEYYEPSQHGWQRTELLDRLPDYWLVRPNGDESVISGFVSGAPPMNRPIGLGAVPWRAWLPPLLFWGPIVLLMGLSMVCLALIVHSQWVHRERLRYPIAEFSESIIDRREGGLLPTIARNKLFWAGLITMVFIRVWNYGHVWYPEYIPQIPLHINLSAAFTDWKEIRKVPQWDMLKYIRFYPAVIGFAFFLSTEISLTLGLSAVLYMIPMYLLVVGWDVKIATHYDTGGPMAYFRGAAYVGLALLLLYNGRRYYTDLLKRAVGLAARTTRVRGYEIAALWLLVIAGATVCGMLIYSGLSWPLAVLTFGFTMISFLGVARITAETGLFFVQPAWQAYAMVLGLFGAYAVGPSGLVMTGLFCAVISIDQSMCLMPYVTNTLKIADRFKVPIGKSGAGAYGMFAVGAVLATVVAIWACYNFSMPSGFYGWSSVRVPRVFFDAAQTEITQVQNTGQLAASAGLSSIERILSIDSVKGFWPFFLAGLFTVAICGLLRNWFTWWPLHPVLFLLFGTFPITTLWFSFLLGWFVKFSVIHMVGHHALEKAKGLFVGIIAGELLASLIVIAIGVIYYLATGLQPETYQFWPR